MKTAESSFLRCVSLRSHFFGTYMHRRMSFSWKTTKPSTAHAFDRYECCFGESPFFSSSLSMPSLDMPVEERSSEGSRPPESSLVLSSGRRILHTTSCARCCFLRRTPSLFCCELSAGRILLPSGTHRRPGHSLSEVATTTSRSSEECIPRSPSRSLKVLFHTAAQCLL